MLRDMRVHSRTRTLYHTGAYKRVRIVTIDGGRGVRQWLSQLGLGVGDIVFVKRNAPFGGPILVEHEGTEVAVGRGIAEKILVEDE